MHYFLFWLLAAILVILIRTVGLIGYGLADVYDMIELGTADPQLIAGAISEVIVSSILAVIFYTIIAYPLYFFMKNRIAYPKWLIAILFAIILCFSFVGDWVILAIKILSASIFVWVSLRPSKKISHPRLDLGSDT